MKTNTAVRYALVTPGYSPYAVNATTNTMSPMRLNPIALNPDETVNVREAHVLIRVKLMNPTISQASSIDNRVRLAITNHTLSKKLSKRNANPVQHGSNSRYVLNPQSPTMLSVMLTTSIAHTECSLHDHPSSSFACSENDTGVKTFNCEIVDPERLNTATINVPMRTGKITVTSKTNFESSS